MTRWSVAAVVALVLAMPGVAAAGWRAECRELARDCRRHHGTTTTTSTTTTTTTIRVGPCQSMNCLGQCVTVNGQEYVLVGDALSGQCLIPGICCVPELACPTTTATSTTT